MSVARDTILIALREMRELEEFAVRNLANVDRFDFSAFRPADRKKIHELLSRLREDSREHEALIAGIIERWADVSKKNSSIPQRDSLGV